MLRKFTTLCLALVCVLSMSLHATAESAAGPSSSSKGIKWPDSQALPSFAKVKHLDVADVYDAPGDVKILLATLQGIVNRNQPRIYLLENEEEGKMTWLNDLQVPYTVHNDPWEVVSEFKHEAKGLIVYDPKVPDSINVATTLAGLKDAVVASPDLVPKLTAAPYGLNVLDDLQGKFKDRMDAYNWQYENLWKQTTHRMLIGLSPDTPVKLPPGLPPSFKVVVEEKTQERDAKNRNTYNLDLTSFLGRDAVYLRFEDAFQQDGWGSAVHEVTVQADGRTIARFVPGTDGETPFLYDAQSSQLSSGSGGHRFADNGRYFVYEFKLPAGTKSLTASVDMWNQFKVYAGNEAPPSSERKEPYGYLRDYAVANKAMVFWLGTNTPEQKALFDKILSDVPAGTPYLGWFSNDTEGEFNGVELLSNHSVYVLAADWFSNLTVFSGTQAKGLGPLPNEKVKAPKLENKIYVTYTFSEGDNFQYNQHRLRQLWDDPNRGKVPINWTSSPLLYDGAPAMLSYYRNTATANDQWVAGPSGGGYFYPNAWPETTLPDFLKKTSSYLKKTGMTVPYVLNRVANQNVPLGDTVVKAYAETYRPNGLFLSWEDRFGVDILNGNLPVSTIRGIGTVEDGQKVLAEAKANWDGQSPLFVSLGLLAWSMTPTDVVRLTDSLGPEFQPVLADPFFTLIREANGLPAKP